MNCSLTSTPSEQAKQSAFGGFVANQSLPTKCDLNRISGSVNLVTHKAGANQELLFNKLTSDCYAKAP
jgi:hypothetical protein